MRKNFLPEMPSPSRLRGILAGAGGQPAPRPPRERRPRGDRERLALTEVRGHLTYTAKTVTAWYTLDEVVWPFRADAAREALISAAAAQYAGLEGLRLHLRRTSVPFPVDRWARNLHANSRPPADEPITAEQMETLYRPGIELPFATTWRQHLTNATDRLVAGQYVAGRTQLGVTFTRPARLLSGRGDEALTKRVAEMTEALAAFGLAARPSTPEEMLWLIYRSVGVGLTPPTHQPGDVEPDDIGEFCDAVDLQRGPYASTTQLTDRRTGLTVHVAVVTVGRMEPQTVPQIHQPWMNLAEQADYPVEWSSRINILGPAASRSSLELRMRLIRSQQRDYQDHGMHEPAELARLVDRAAQVGDQIDTGLPVDAARAHGVHRMAVAAPTQEECLARVRDLVRLYDKARITLVHPKAQYRLLREFIPGEPVANTGYLRRMPVTLLAAGVPQASGVVGDNRGDLIGHTGAGGCRPVFYDPHYPMEVRERSGLAVIVSEPGGGKSTLMGALGYLNARRGVQVTLMDPSGPLARLCRLPELRRHARVVDLTAGAEPGTLAPYALIPTPRRDAFPPGPAGDREYEQETAMAEAERYALVLDVTQMLLPPQMLTNDVAVVALREALRLVPPYETSTLDDVVAALRTVAHQGSAAASTIADILLDSQRMPLARLFFGSPPADTLGTDATLTVITMGGLRLPDMSIPRQFWSVEESLAVPMVHLANRLAVRRAYSGDPHARKYAGLDEAHFMSGWPSGRAFLIRLSRDSRKYNLAATIASQNPQDILGLDVQNLVSTVFVGRVTDDQRVAGEAVRLLGDSLVGGGYESTLAALSQHTGSDRLGYREFVMRDVDGRVQKIRVDVSYVPGLLAALDTTPRGTR